MATHVIRVDGYMAFHGIMRIVPKTSTVAPFEKLSDWLYKPEYKCWYCKEGNSYPEEICSIEEVM